MSVYTTNGCFLPHNVQIPYHLKISKYPPSGLLPKSLLMTKMNRNTSAPKCYSSSAGLVSKYRLKRIMVNSHTAVNKAAMRCDLGLPAGASGEEPSRQCMRCKGHGFDPGVGKIPRRRKRMATHCSLLAWRTPMHRGAWWASVHSVTQSWT